MPPIFKACDLCGLDVESDYPLQTDDRELHFCCSGCREIYMLVNQVEESVPEHK